MAKLKALILAGGALFALARAAVAADLLPPAPALEPLPPAMAEFNGWYLRGDVGIGANAGDAEPRQHAQSAPDRLGRWLLHRHADAKLQQFDDFRVDECSISASDTSSTTGFAST